MNRRRDEDTCLKTGRVGAVITLGQKVTVTVVVVALNVLVLVLVGWLVVVTAIPSLLFRAAILTR